MKVTAQMLADECGVSRGTVDRVVNGRGGVAPEVRARIEEAIERTGYRTPAARRFTGSRTTVGLILPRRELSYYNGQMRAGVRSALRHIPGSDFGVAVEELAGGGARECLSLIERMLDQDVRGFILNASDVPALEGEIDRLWARGVPVVTCDSDVPASRRICHIGQDPKRSGRMAAGLMARLAPTGELLIVTGNSEFTTHRGRVDGFCERLNERKGAQRYRVIECIERYDLTYDGVLREARENPRLRGIYMATENVEGCVDALRRARLTEKVHVICHDLTPWARSFLLDGRVDFVIDLDFAKHAERAVLTLYELFLRNKPPACDVEYVPTRIVTREMVE